MFIYFFEQTIDCSRFVLASVSCEIRRMCGFCVSLWRGVYSLKDSESVTAFVCSVNSFFNH